MRSRELFFRCAGKEIKKELPEGGVDIAVAVNANNAETAVIAA